MPPKAKFSRADIVKLGLEITKEKGIEGVTAAELSKRLGTSVSPIFTHFSTLEEIRREVKQEARLVFDRYLQVADDYHPAFKMRGMQMIRFSKEEPALFRLLFMNRQKPVSFQTLMQTWIHGFEEDIREIQRNYPVSAREAEHLFQQLWVHAYGICALYATNMSYFTEEEIASLFGETFAGMLLVLQRGSGEFTKVLPAKKDSEAGQTLRGALPIV